jgi:hypothetical protein
MTNKAQAPLITWNMHPGIVGMLNVGDYFKFTDRDEALGVIAILPCALEGRKNLRLVGNGGTIFDQDYADNTPIRAMGDVTEVGWTEIDLDTIILGDKIRNVKSDDDGLDSVGAGV